MMGDAAEKLANLLTGLCRVAVGVSFGVLMLAVLVQVLGRSVFGSSPVWTEELTRYALLYLAAFGAGLALRSGDMVNVDLISERLPGRGPWVMRLLGALAVMGFCLPLLGPAWKYVSIGSRQTSPALGWRMDFIHASVLVLLVGLMVFAALRVLGMLSGANDGLPKKAPEEMQ